MTDRELLELAARAAGIELTPMQINNVTQQGDDRFIGYMTDATKSEFKRGWFNPLDDDGDALRLAVKLGIAITPYPIYAPEKHSVIAKRYRNTDKMRVANPTEVVELHNDDPCAAARRAIVRAAAEIGKGMK